MCGWENLPAPYCVPNQWNDETDAVIIGSGLAGLTAAAEAARRGLRVTVIEKMTYPGGNTSVSGGGYCCWDSKLKMRERLGLGEDSWQLHMEDTLRGGAYFGDPKLVEILVKEAPAGLDMLADAGVEFAETLPRIGGHSAHRSYQEKGGSGRNIVDAMRRQAESLGVQILFGAEVMGIYREDAMSPVSGVEICTADGESVSLHAKRGVVIASGGFGRDAEMRTLYRPSLPDSLGCNNHKGATGEVIRYAMSIGAAALHMSFIQLYPCASPSGGMDRFAFDCYSGTGYGLIYVFGEGRRFVNELAGRDEVSDAQLKLPSKPSWSILNQSIFEKLATQAETIEKAVRQGRILTAQSIEELAAAMGISSAALAETAAKHNDFILSGKDLDFGKPISSAMIPLKEGPFYAIPQWPTIHYCMGGLMINEDAAVLDIRGKAIPGLFAAGEATGGIHGANRLGGNALADCAVFGRRAGIALAEK